VFRSLCAHPQETPHKQHLVYCMHVMSVGFTRIEVLMQPTDIIHMHIPSVACVAPPEDEQVMLETCRGP
jgi:hypothetical protein